MKRIASSLAALAMGLGIAQGAQAVTVQFPDGTATFVSSSCSIDPASIGCYWSVARGDRVQQVIDGGAGLASVDFLGLGVDLLSRFTLTDTILAQVDWEVSLNGTVVGTWTVFETDGSGLFSNDFAFGAIAGQDLGVGAAGANDYTLLMRVTNEVDSGAGSVELFRGDGFADLTLSQTPGIPEPASLALLGLGLLGLGLTRRRSV